MKKTLIEGKKTLIEQAEELYGYSPMSETGKAIKILKDFHDDSCEQLRPPMYGYPYQREADE